MKFCDEHPELLHYAVIKCNKYKQIVSQVSSGGGFSIEKTETNQSRKADEGEQDLVSLRFINKIVSHVTVDEHGSWRREEGGERVVWRRKDWKK